MTAPGTKFWSTFNVSTSVSSMQGLTEVPEYTTGTCCEAVALRFCPTPSKTSYPF